MGIQTSPKQLLWTSGKAFHLPGSAYNPCKLAIPCLAAFVSSGESLASTTAERSGFALCKVGLFGGKFFRNTPGSQGAMSAIRHTSSQALPMLASLGSPLFTSFVAFNGGFIDTAALMTMLSMGRGKRTVDSSNLVIVEIMAQNDRRCKNKSKKNSHVGGVDRGQVVKCDGSERTPIL
ncbi:unnamed protein product [Aphanomyces euteiches]